MDALFSNREVAILLESLSYTKLHVEQTAYPSYAMKVEKLREVDSLMWKLQEIKPSCGTGACGA